MTVRKSLIRKVSPVVFGLAAFLATEVQASCNATVNGKPMTWEECEAACYIYGDYPYGRYLRDEKGNWVNIDNPSEQGNAYLDAPYSSGCRGSGPGESGDDSSGCISTEWFGGACIW